MFCANCGAKIEEGKFCPNCGYKINSQIQVDSNAVCSNITNKDVLYRLR